MADQSQHNVDFKSEQKLPPPKKQKTMLSDVDPTTLGESKFVTFYDMHGDNSEKMFDERLLDSFDTLKALWESCNKTLIPLETEKFDVLPYINMIFYEKNFSQIIKKVIDTDINKVDFNEIINIIKFIDQYDNTNKLEDTCILKNNWLLTFVDDVLNCTRLNTNFMEYWYNKIKNEDNTKEQKIFKIVDTVFKICCDNYIKLCEVREIPRQPHDDICVCVHGHQTKFVSRLPNLYAKYVLNKLFKNDNFKLIV